MKHLLNQLCICNNMVVYKTEKRSQGTKSPPVLSECCIYLEKPANVEAESTTSVF